MTFEEFIENFNNKAVDFDYISGVQCVDTAKMYLYYVLDIKPRIIGNASEYVDRYYELPYLYENFDFIFYNKNKPFLTQKGDLAVWNKDFSPTGHIALCDGENFLDGFICYEQNGDVKELTKVFHKFTDGFAGVLRHR